MPASTQPEPIPPLLPHARWPLERVLFALAGTMALLSAALSAIVSHWFLLLTAFVGINQWLYVLIGTCPASAILRRVFSLRSAIYPSADGQAGFCATPALDPSARDRRRPERRDPPSSLTVGGRSS